MATIFESVPRSPFGGGAGRPKSRGSHFPSPLTSSESPHGDPMEFTSPTSTTMQPPAQSSPELEHGGGLTPNGNTDGNASIGIGIGINTTGSAAAAAATAGSSQGPKVVQTAFIHKLYNMLEDRSIQHLISWSATNESFVMSPSNEFSKVLAQYFKHTNISSFVRQLNMYGFHKVSDVFHTGSPDSTLWEFKHGNGSFKKGDLTGLREIKRRASRHALIHRDSFSGQKSTASQPGTPAEPMPDTTEARLLHLETAYYDLLSRLARTEESYALMSSRCQALTEGLVRCHQWTNSLAHYVQSVTPTESSLYSEVASMQREIARQLDLVRALENPHEALLSGRHPYFSNMTLDAPPLSPRQMPFDESRRSSMQMLEPPRLNTVRPAMPPHVPVSPRRLGSVGGPGSSVFTRPALPPQPPPPPPPPPHAHPLSSVASPPLPPNLARRHTSADIREHGWPLPNANGSPYASGQSSIQWPSSPHHGPHAGDQQLRDQLAQYDMNAPRRQTISSRQPSPPLTAEPPPSAFAGDAVSWSIGGPKFPRPGFDLHSAPATRRSSLASNVHSLLNPAETAEREEEDVGPTDDRKRKRLQ